MKYAVCSSNDPMLVEFLMDRGCNNNVDKILESVLASGNSTANNDTANDDKTEGTGTMDPD